MKSSLSSACHMLFLVVTLNIFLQPAKSQLNLNADKITHITCNGSQDGSFSVSGSGGSGNYSYTIDNGANWQTSNRFENLFAKKYSVGIRDVVTSDELLDQLTITITEPLELIMALSITQPFCEGNNGTIVINATGGIGDYMYSIDGLNWTNNPMFTDLSTGNYSVMLRDENDCMKAQQVQLDEPEIATASGSGEICATTAQLNANNPAFGTGVWSVVKGKGIFENPLSPENTVSEVAPGTNVYRWTVIGSGCSSHADVEVISNLLEANAGTDAEQCSDTYTLSATVPEENVYGQWTIEKGSGRLTDGTSPNSEVSELERGENILTWTLTKKGCSSSASVTLTNNSATKAIVGSDQIICGYETGLYGNSPNASSGEYGAWSLINGSGGFIDINDPNSRVTHIAQGSNTYRWTISHKDCSSHADITVTSNKVNVNAGSDREVCEKTVQLNAQEPNAGDVGEWSIVSGVGSGIIKAGEQNTPNALVGGLDYGTNGFIWAINHNGCISSDTVYIANNNPYYIDNYGDKRMISAGEPIIVKNDFVYMNADSPDVGIGEWSLISGAGNIESINNANTVISDLGTGESTFRWTVTNRSCSYYSDVTVTYGIPSSIDNNNDYQLSINPNPANETINIQLNNVIKSVQLVNLQGKVFKTLEGMNKTQLEINVSSYTPGIYLLRVIDDNDKVRQQKVVIK